MDKKRLQWHPGFFAVLQIELEEERRFLRFYAEYNLTRKPLQIDVLVVRKETGRVIQKNIGRIFRQYNVVEYKGIKDYISINDFYKICVFTAVQYGEGPGDFAVSGDGHIGRGTLSAEPACVFGKGLWSAYGGGSPGDILH